ncbi:MAG: 50S ribosomal protein L17 [Muribaculaceae bacterium]|nr:50S ribosomal protein L17 [Muribaculaceae bacterium]
MRHAKKFNHLSRKKAHRDSLLANMTVSLILKKRIFTTLAKAKALRVYAEPLINRAKEDTMTNRRVVFSYLQNKEAIKELFNDVAQKIADRPGGYTRILKTGNRLGDNAKTCFIELVDYNEAMLKDTKASKAKATRRSRRSKAKEEVARAVEAPTAAEKELPAAEPETPATEAPAAE